MSKLPKIGHDVAADNYVLSEDIGRMAGKTIKTVRLGIPESKITQMEPKYCSLSLQMARPFAYTQGQM